MRESLRLIVMICVLTGCGGTPHRPDGTVVAISGAEFIYRGKITQEANARLFSLAAAGEERPTTLAITSSGGDVEAGIELGTWVFERKLNVHVTEFCMSSCANYVFVAGIEKILDPTAMLLWHGGATQQFDLGCKVAWQGKPEDCDEEALRGALSDRLTTFRSMESGFFEKIGVDQRITVLGQEPAYDCRDDDGYSGWYYSVEDLESLGIDGIVVPGSAWQPVAPSPEIRLCRADLRRAPDEADHR